MHGRMGEVLCAMDGRIKAGCVKKPQLAYAIRTDT